MKRFLVAALATILIFATSLLFIDTNTPQVNPDGDSQGTSVADDTTEEKTEFNLPEDGYIEGEFDGHRVIVVGDDLPEGATLSLTEVDMDSAQQLVEKMHKKKAVFACDIKVIDGNGKEWQPDDSVEVIVSDMDMEDSLMLGMLHLDGDLEQAASAKNPANLVDDFKNVNNLDSNHAIFETGSFSTFVGYTVDFHYAGTTFSINGETSILLSDLFKELSIDRDATTAYDVTFSDETLVTVTRQEDGDWLITSLKAFNTDEELNVYFDDEVINIDVTDAASYSAATITSATITTAKPSKYTRARWRVTAGKCSLCSNGKCASGTWHSFNRNLTIKGTSTLTMYEGAIHMGGKFNIYGSLTIKPGSWTTTSHAFRRMKGSFGSDDTNTTVTNVGPLATVEDGAHLYVSGTSTKEIVFAGDMSATSNDRHAAESPLIKLGVESAAPGTCTFTYTRFSDALDNTGTGNSGTSESSGMATAGIAIDGPGGASANITFTNCEFENLGKNSTTSNLVTAGSAVHLDNGLRINSVSFSKCTFTNCQATLGGAVRVANDEYNDSSAKTQKLTFTGCTFTSCKAQAGGAICFDGTVKEQVVVSGCNFTSCKAASGAAMYFSGKYQSDLEKGIKLTGGTVINNCDTDTDYDKGVADRPNIGGAIASYHDGTGIAQLICDSVTIKSCNANDGMKGGAINWGFSNAKSSITLNSKCSITSNSAHTISGDVKGTGGAIWLRNNTLNIEGATISSNTSYNAGGAIRACAGSKINMSSGTISGNKANKTLAGAIYLETSTTFNLSGGTIKSNKTVAASQNAGAVYTNGTMTMTGGTITGNTSTGEGGGIYNTGTLTISGGSITSNTATHGAGIRNTGTATIKYVETTAGAADTSKLEISTVPTISSNKASTNGGGVNSTGKLTITGGVFKSNTASGYGGAVYGTAGSTYLRIDGATAGMTAASKEKTGSDFTILISGNTAKRGGGVAARGTSDALIQTHISEAEICKNKATSTDSASSGTEGGGGGIWMAFAKPYSSDGNVLITNVQIYSNTTTSLGGGLYAYGCSDIMMTSANIYSNKSDNGTTSNHGGGVYLNSTTATLDSGKIYGNTSSGNGGGVCVAAAATFKTTSDSAIIGISGSPNKANQGGGIYCRNGYLSMSYGKVQYNEATGGNGGGIYFYGNYTTTNKYTATISNANISYNKAYSNGGGIATFGGIFTVNNSTVISYNEAATSGTSNHGGGIYIRKDNANYLSRLQVNGTQENMVKIHHNTTTGNGGGICATNKDSNLDLHPEISLQEVEIYNNEAKTNAGGGVYIRGSDYDKTGSGYYDNATNAPRLVVAADNYAIRLNYVRVYNNKAGLYGGGIFANGGLFNLRGSTIYNNTAQYGGGVCVFKNDAGYNTSNNDTKLALTTYATAYPTSVYNNTATVMGGGVYAGCRQTNQSSTGSAILYVDGATVKNNTAKSEDGSNANGGGIAVQSVKVFTDGDTTKEQLGVITGQAYLYRNQASSVISAIENNTAVNGGGGGIFITGSADVYDFGVYIRYNKATGTNDANTKWNARTTAGIGGGVYVDSGFASKSNNTNYAYRFGTAYPEGPQLSNGKYNIGLYRNEASFAADDIYATGIKTNIGAPDSGQLGLLNYNGEVSGWYEDYANNDTSYGISGASTTVDETSVSTIGTKQNTVASRYNSSIHTPVSATFNKDKSYVDYIDGGTLTGTNKIVPGADNRYLALTVGIRSAGFLTVNKNVVDNAGNDLNDVDDTKYIFQIKKVMTDGSGEQTLTSTEIDKITCDVTSLEGTTLEDQILDSEGKFTLAGGESVFIENLPYGDDFNLIVKELVTGQDYCYKVAETENQYYIDGLEDNATSGTNGVQTEVMAVDDGARFIVDFTNTMNEIEVNIKYYNRDYVKIADGEPVNTDGNPAEIADTATVYTQKFFPTEDFANMITKTAVVANANAGLVNNILDDYYCYTSQADAKTATNSDVHSNKYGKYADYTDDTSSEKWVTYLDANGNELEENDTTLKQNKLKSITVWLQNSPKKYNYKVYQAQTAEELSALGDGKYIAKANDSGLLNTLNTNDADYNPEAEEQETGSANVAYYNQRFDRLYNTGSLEGASDQTTNYLKGYGLKAWLDAVPDTAETIDVNGTEYKFSYWAFDPEGTQVASTEITYPYRITSDLTLYAVYEEEPSTTVGLSVTKNAVDVYTEGTTSKTALNTVMNPYNCTVNDPNIYDVGVIYVIDSKGNVSEDALDLDAAYVDPSIVTERTLYFVPDTSWGTGTYEAVLTKVVEVETVDGEGNITVTPTIEATESVSMSYNSTYGLYECTFAVGEWTNVEFRKVDSNATILKQTGSLDLGETNCYTITTPTGEWSEGTAGTLTLVPGVWTGSNYYARFAQEVETTKKYKTDENGEIVLDTNGNPVEAGDTDTLFTEVTVTETQYNWVSMSGSNGTYTCNIPDGDYTDVSFCQMDDSGTLDNDHIVSQTEDFALGDDTCFTVDSLGEWSSYSKTKTYYFTPDEDWLVEGATFQAHFTKELQVANAVAPVSDTDDGLWVTLTDDDGDGTYECTVQNSGWTNVTFCQMIDGAVNNKSESIALTSGDDLFTLNSYAGEWSATPTTSITFVPGTYWTTGYYAARFSYVTETEKTIYYDADGNEVSSAVEGGSSEVVTVTETTYSDFIPVTDNKVAIPKGNWTQITFYAMNSATYTEDNIAEHTDDLALGLGDTFTLTQATTTQTTTGDDGETTETINATGSWSTTPVTTLKFVPGTVWTGGNYAARFTIVTETKSDQQMTDEDGNLVEDEDGNPVYEIIETITYTDFFAVTDSDGDGILDVTIPDGVSRVTFYQMDGNGYTEDNIVKHTDELALGTDDTLTLTNRTGEWSTYVPPTEDVYTNLDKIRDVIKAKLDASITANNTSSGKLTLNLSAELASLGITKGNCRVYYVRNGNVLTSRNRVQFTEKFTTSTLANMRIYAFAAMYYAGEENQWIVSDNCIDYRFDANGAEYVAPEVTPDEDTE